MNFRDAYCPECKTTHKLEYKPTPVGNLWMCAVNTLDSYRKVKVKYFTDLELNQAFTAISKDPEYAAKGISMEKSPLIHTPSDPTLPLRLTLPTDSEERKGYPLLSGCLKYFAAALAGVARTSKNGNDKHNPGQPLHHARGKSSDHGDCIVRHLMDVEDLLAARERGDASITDRQILDEAGSLAWRALAYSQELHEKLGAAPLAPAAK